MGQLTLTFCEPTPLTAVRRCSIARCVDPPSVPILTPLFRCFFLVCMCRALLLSRSVCPRVRLGCHSTGLLLSAGLTGKEPHIRFFWQTLKAFNDEQRRRFVRFVWAQERLPTTDDEWGNTRFLIKDKKAPAGASVDDVFPRADTCFFNLSLPRYSSLRVMQEKLTVCIDMDVDAMDADERQVDLDGNQVDDEAAAFLGGLPGMLNGFVRR